MVSLFKWLRRTEAPPHPNTEAAAACVRRGNELLDGNKLEEAAAQYRAALEFDPSNGDACINLGFVLKELANPGPARQYLEQAIRINAKSADAHYLLGLVTEMLGDGEAAIQHFSEAVNCKPDFGLAWLDLCRAQFHAGQIEAAKSAAERSLAIDPQSAGAHHYLGNIHMREKAHELAVTCYNKALSLAPDYAEAHYSRGCALWELDRTGDALASYDLAIRINPDYAMAYADRGTALQNLGHLEDALASYGEALRIKPDFADVYNNRGTVFEKLNRLEDALADYDAAIRISPADAEAHTNRGNALKRLNRLEDALASHDRAISSNPRYAEAHFNRGAVLEELGRLNDALASYAQAINIKPDLASAYYNRGSTLVKLKQYQAALADYERALALDASLDYLQGMALHTRMKMCLWPGFSSALDQLVEKIAHGHKCSLPFPVLSLTADLAAQRKGAETYCANSHPANPELGPSVKPSRHDKIRIGYYSADFRHHPVSYLIAEVLELHDRSAFEVIGFAFGNDSQDEMRQRIRAGCDRFIDVRSMSDRQVTEVSRAMGIDIAIDLGGYTEGARTDIFAMRAAPVQVSYIGYLGTMGAPYIDYLLADKTIVPESHQPYYREKIAYLPSYQANDSKRTIAAREFSRADLGLPNTGFVFCCFNSNYKITPPTFNGWMRILQKVAGSVLFLLGDNDSAVSNLRREAEQRGIDPARLVFGAWLPRPEYLARYRAADLFIDTLPYNAGTTASDALWAGLPVLTQTGDSFASRVAASLLNAIGLPELITSTQDEYETLAVELATDPGKLNSIRHKLEQNRRTTPLFNSSQFTRHLESAYAAMHERCQAGLPPDHIFPGDGLGIAQARAAH